MYAGVDDPSKWIPTPFPIRSVQTVNMQRSLDPVRRTISLALTVRYQPRSK